MPLRGVPYRGYAHSTFHCLLPLATQISNDPRAGCLRWAWVQWIQQLFPQLPYHSTGSRPGYPVSDTTPRHCTKGRWMMAHCWGWCTHVRDPGVFSSSLTHI